MAPERARRCDADGLKSRRRLSKIITGKQWVIVKRTASGDGPAADCRSALAGPGKLAYRSAGSISGATRARSTGSRRRSNQGFRLSQPVLRQDGCGSGMKSGR